MESGQIDVLRQGVRLSPVLAVGAFLLLLERLDLRREQTVQSKLRSLLEAEGGAFVEQRLSQQWLAPQLGGHRVHLHGMTVPNYRDLGPCRAPATKATMVQWISPSTSRIGGSCGGRSTGPMSCSTISNSCNSGASPRCRHGVATGQRRCAGHRSRPAFATRASRVSLA